MPAWNGLTNYVQSIGDYTRLQIWSTAERDLNRVVNKSYSGRRIKALLVALTGNAAGQSKALSRKRIAHNVDPSGFSLGGKRTIETVSVLTGNTTNADITRMDNIILGKLTKPSTYPVNKDGIGAGGRVNAL